VADRGKGKKIGKMEREMDGGSKIDVTNAVALMTHQAMGHNFIYGSKKI